MGWILVIEENQGLLNEIKETLALVDPKATVVHFSDSSAFLHWMDQLQAHDPETSPPYPKDKFLGIITAIETWKFKDLKLIGKFKALFVQKGFAQKEEEIFVMFTAYDSPNFQKKRFEYRSVNNVVFKPFDKLILQQMMNVSLKGRQALKNELTHTLKSEAQFEMLKEIQLTAIGELGFQTVSNQKIEPGAIAKYYADFLETRQHRSALAQIISVSAPSTATATAPDAVASDQALSTIELRFFALDQSQSFNLQKLAQKEKTRRTLDGAPANAEDYEFYFVKRDGSSLCEEVRPSFERFFDHQNLMVESLTELDERLSLSTATVKKRFVFLDHGHIAGEEVREVDLLLATHADKNIAVSILSPRILPEPLELELSSRCEDIYYAPFNRSYIVKALKRKWTALKNKEELFESHHAVEQSIFVSNPVKLVELSEAGLIMEYHREIHLGSFREFHFTMADETEVPPILAQCNFNEPGSDKKTFFCHFVFFGMRDHELKFIRRWMLNQYVEEKQKSSGGGE